jgi:multiple sugar transport system substrate-binding protein
LRQEGELINRGNERNRAALPLFLAVAVTLGSLLVACGGGGSGGGPATLSWFIAIQPGGTVEKVADDCSKQSGGQYQIEPQYLPTDATQAREELVRRLAAEDSSIDLIGMDVIYTGELANAGWVRPWPKELSKQVTKGVFESVIKTASFEGRLYGAPFNSNTQLLWYRKDLVKKAPLTWSQMIDEAERLGPENSGQIEVQADKYEGYTAWVNAMIDSAGGRILSGPETVDLPRGPTEKALQAIGRLAHSSAASPTISTSDEDTSRLAFEAGDAAFMVNYTFAYASAKDLAPDIAKKMGFAKWPEVVEGRRSRPPLGGFNIGVSSYSKNPDLAFQAGMCINSNRSMLTATELDGLPPARPSLYSNEIVTGAYPGFAALVKRSIEEAGPRPQTPAYQDVTLAVQDALQPPEVIDPDDPGAAYDDLRSKLEQAVNREGLL